MLATISPGAPRRQINLDVVARATADTTRMIWFIPARPAQPGFAIEMVAIGEGVDFAGAVIVHEQLRV